MVLIQKKDGTTRFCLDFHWVNAVLWYYLYPLPRINECIDALGENSCISTLDLELGYCQIALHPDSKDKTTIMTSSCLFQFKFMAFGLCNALATFEQMTEKILEGLL